MKKNGEFAGVDEKFIPEDEKYVDESLLGNREQTKKTITKVAKGLGIGYLVFIVIFLVIFVGIFIFAGSFIFKVGKTVDEQFDNFGNAMNQINDETQNQEDTTDMINEMQDVMGGMSSMMNQFMNNESRSINKTSFNATLEMYSGTKYGSSVGKLLDKVVTSNKTNKDNIITVIYKEITATSEDEIVNIKHSLDKFTEYEVSLDYDTNGLVNKVTIKDIE